MVPVIVDDVVYTTGGVVRCAVGAAPDLRKSIDNAFGAVRAGIVNEGAVLVAELVVVDETLLTLCTT